MNRKKYVFGSNRKGVYLTEEQFTLLKFISEQRIVTSRQIFNYLESLGVNTTFDSLRNKLTKWNDYKVIKSHPQSFRMIKSNYYQIGETGIKILQEEELIPKKFIHKDYSKVGNIARFLTLQDIVTETICKLNNLNEPVESIDPARLNLSIKLGNYGWILKSKDRLVLIELRISTFSFPYLTTRVHENKELLLKESKNLDVHHVICLLDEDFKSDYNQNKYSKKVDRLQRKIDNHKLNEENLRITVVQLSEVIDKLVKIITYKSN